MKNPYTHLSISGRLFSLLILFLSFSISAQVGIGNTNPAASSVLDVTSTTKGMLVPRMTTAQRAAITTPANSLLVYDTNLESFFHFDSTPAPGSWVKINSTANERNNYKLVKSVSDLAPELSAGGNNRYLLQTNTYYEINGTINLAHPVDLNNAYVSGLDANEDILSRSSGPVFQGTTGGSIRNITITGGGTAFNITGGTSLLVQNTIITGMASVGTISNLGLYFGNIVQFLNNTNGITYNNIGSLLLSNQAWFGGNGGTYETFTGTFTQIQKVSGFSIVNDTNTAIDVSSNPTVGNAVLLSTVFSGTGMYVKGYTAGSYSGYNFNNNWHVNCPGIPVETDDVATGDITLATPIVTTTFTGNGPSGRTKLAGNTQSNNLFRFTRVLNNRIDYKGTKTRYFQLVSSLSFEQSDLATYIFYIAVNGTIVDQSKVFTRPDAAQGIFVSTNAGIQSAPIVATLFLKTNDRIEIFVERAFGTGSITPVSLNLSIR